ncbi:MAG: hypothetical protein CMH30_05885 [Micavibrio sp.]|nr:hypothetical protein [Micavibrio sp.]
MQPRIILLLTFFALLIAGVSYSYAQTIRKSGNDLQIYDGGTWRSMNNATLGSCAGTAAGTMRYNAGASRMEFCNGANWMSMDSGVNAGGCGGIAAGTVRYSGGQVQFCNGSNWRNGYSLAVNGSCGAAAGGAAVAAQPTSSQCSAGNYADTGDTSSYWQWYCTGINGGASAFCQRARSATVVNGACGSAASGGAVISQPSYNHCSAGSFSDTSDTSTSWRWYCNGTGGGNNTLCTRTAGVDGDCGPAASGGAVSSQPTSGHCSAGSFSDFSDTQFVWRWWCNGSGGGSTTICNRNRTQSGGANCTAGERGSNGCFLPTGSDGQTSGGTCIGTGTCSATCNNGAWTNFQDNCSCQFC